jgi:hypothetical protein
MLERHLLPDELERLLDDEAGPDVAPLRAHVTACAECQERLTVEQELLELLDHLPYTSPGGGFQQRVMSQVQVFEPWHVALRDTLRLLVPPPGPWRAIVGVGIAGAVVSLSAMVLWVALRFDMALYVGQLAVERAQQALVAGVGGLVQLALGDAAAAALQSSGAPSVLLALAGIGSTLLVATLGLRGLVAVARRRRN